MTTKPNASPIQDDGSWLEGRKMFFDALKHLSTLSSGAILVLSTLSKDAFHDIRHKWLVALAFSLLLVSPAVTFFVMNTVARFVSSSRTSDGEMGRTVGMFFFALATFCLGLACVLVLIWMKI
jgi:hypothetical protein